MKLNPPIYLPYIKSLIISLTVLPLTLLFLSLIMYLLQLPKEIAPVMGTAALCNAVLWGGYRLGRLKKQRGIKQGCLCGGSVFVLALIFSLIFGSATFWGAAGKLLLCLLFGMFGSVWGVNRQKQ